MFHTKYQSSRRCGFWQNICIPCRWNWEGILFWRCPSVLRFVHPSAVCSMHIEQLSFRASFLQLLAWIQWNFIGTINIKGRAFKTELCPLIMFSMHIEQLLDWYQQDFMGIISTKRKFACHDKFTQIKPYVSSRCVSNNHYSAGYIN
jgi:hypothetical protein